MLNLLLFLTVYLLKSNVLLFLCGSEAWGMILIMCLVMIDGRRRNVSEYWIFICKTSPSPIFPQFNVTAPGWGNPAVYRGDPVQNPVAFLIRNTRRMDFFFSKKPFWDGQMHELLILTESRIYLISVFVAAVEVTILSVTEGFTFCLCFATHEYMLTSTSCAYTVRVCVGGHTCMPEYVYARVSIKTEDSIYLKSIYVFFKCVFLIYEVQDIAAICVELGASVRSVDACYFLMGLILLSHCCQML